MLSAPRPSPATPNAVATKVAFTQSAYSFASHATTTQLRVLDVAAADGAPAAIAAGDINAFAWLPPTAANGHADDLLVWLLGQESGNTAVVVGDAAGRDSYVAGVVPGAVGDLRVTDLGDNDDGTIAIAVSGKAWKADGTMHHPANAPTPYSSARVYTSLFVRQWNEYVDPATRAAVFVGVLRLRSRSVADKKKRYVLSELQNVLALAGLDLECPIPPFGGTDHFDICPAGVILIAKDPKSSPALHTRCRLYAIKLASWTAPEAKAACEMDLGESLGLYGALSGPVLVPGGEKLAVLAMREDGYESDKNRVVVIDRPFEIDEDEASAGQGPGAVELFATADGIGAFDRSPAAVVWEADGNGLFILAQNEGRVVAFRLAATGALSTRTVDDLVPMTTSSGGAKGKGSVKNLEVAASSSKVVISGTSIVCPGWFSVVDIGTIEGSGSDKVSAAGIVQREFVLGLTTDKTGNALGGETYGLSASQVSSVWYPGARPGTRVQAWLVTPSDCTPNLDHSSSKKYPLALLIHGGPQGAWLDAWNTRWNPAVFAEAGFVVLAPNLTGSTGFGQGWTDAIRGQWGGDPYVELEHAFKYAERELDGSKIGEEDAEVRGLGLVDTKRAVALGASYGGFMVNWLNGQPLGRKLRALVNHDGIFSTRTSLSTDELFFVFHDLKGPAWTPPAAAADGEATPALASGGTHCAGDSDPNPTWHANDPAAPAALARWSTPTLVIHGGRDYRLGIAEGLATFNVLQARGVESKLLLFPDEGHHVLKPENSLVWHEEVLGWSRAHVE